MKLIQSTGLFFALFASSSTAFPTAFRPTRSNTQLDMANIAVFGASGLTASECVYQALENGDTVVGLTRYVLLFPVVAVWAAVGNFLTFLAFSLIPSLLFV
jgi:hypothetical protein